MVNSDSTVVTAGRVTAQYSRSKGRRLIFQRKLNFNEITEHYFSFRLRSSYVVEETLYYAHNDLVLQKSVGT